jgi:hypothetical protein
LVFPHGRNSGWWGVIWARHEPTTAEMISKTRFITCSLIMNVRVSLNVFI